MPRVLLTGIPSPQLFLASQYRDYDIVYSQRGKDRRTIGDLREDFRVCGNTGNLLIGEGAAGALSASDYTYLPLWYLMEIVKDEQRLAGLQGAFDLVIMATANIFRRNHDARVEADTLRAIGLPTYLLGAGIQRKDLLAEMPSGTLDLIDFLAADENGVFTRGEDAASFLTDHGVKNVIPTGCPSVYLKPDGMRKALAQLNKLDFESLETVMIGGYVGHAVTDMDIATFASTGARVACVVQDEFIEYKLTLDNEDAPGRAYNSVTGEILTTYYHPKQPESALRPPLHMFFDTNDWRGWASGFSLFFGRRFHGGVLAMQTGVPALFVTIDDRMREMLNWMGFPYLENDDYNPKSGKIEFLKEFTADIDSDALVRKYDERETSFRSALAKIGITAVEEAAETVA